MPGAATPERAGGNGRIALLDGLRGLCALLIVFFHFHMVGDGLHNHAYLAVDVYFLLSGFVVASAYEARLKSGAGVGWFFGVRMARLYPLYILLFLFDFPYTGLTARSACGPTRENSTWSRIATCRATVPIWPWCSARRRSSAMSWCGCMNRCRRWT
jgi:peptidoglycan/LPS O-acetylase OafA/YrhL